MNTEYKLKVDIQASSREEYRKKLINLFLEEKHGTKDNFTYYYYYVEKTSDGTEIYLKRPTSLNKGVDFEVRITNVQFRYGIRGNVISTGNRPSHKDLFDDLEIKISESKDKSRYLLNLITKVYNCIPVELDEIKSLDYHEGISLELLLVILKWLFIEQDITYWNRSGRFMLYNGILEIFEKFS